jgi:dTDP-L-rhamnose 4-epimerase
VYGITKQVQEQLVLTVAEALGIKGVALRYQNVYGPGQSLTNPYTGILSIFSSRILQNQSINIFEDGLESRDFVFIDDVVKATALAIEHNTINTLVCNVGTGIPITVKQVVENLLSGFNKEVLVQITGNYRVGDIRHNFADITKMKQELGVVQLTPFEDGITAFIEWVKKQNIASCNYELSLEEMKNKGLFK